MWVFGSKINALKTEVRLWESGSSGQAGNRVQGQAGEMAARRRGAFQSGTRNDGRVGGCKRQWSNGEADLSQEMEVDDGKRNDIGGRQKGGGVV